MGITTVKAPLSWKEALQAEKEADYFDEIMQTLQQWRQRGDMIYPPADQVFRALALTPFDQVKVVILGQDPYHGHGQAHGLCFSVPDGVRKPPSLQNIMKELRDDLGITERESGDLSGWARQGVLLLNSTLTVQANQPLSHGKLGWQRFTDAVIMALNQAPEPIVYLLWGAHAGKKASIIDCSRHKILATTHPSPLSAHRGFLGSRPFSQANAILQSWGREQVIW